MVVAANGPTSISEQSTLGPVIEQVPANGEKEITHEVAASASPVHDEPALEQAESGPVAAVAEDTFPTEPIYEWEASRTGGSSGGRFRDAGR